MNKSLTERIRESADIIKAKEDDVVYEILNCYDSNNVAQIVELTNALKDWAIRFAKPAEPLKYVVTQMMKWCQAAYKIDRGCEPQQAINSLKFIETDKVTGPIAQWYIGTVGYNVIN